VQGHVDGPGILTAFDPVFDPVSPGFDLQTPTARPLCNHLRVFSGTFTSVSSRWSEGRTRADRVDYRIGERQNARAVHVTLHHVPASGLPAAVGSSRFTFEPGLSAQGRSGPSVSWATSAWNKVGSMSRAVRHTPTPPANRLRGAVPQSPAPPR